MPKNNNQKLKAQAVPTKRPGGMMGGPGRGFGAPADKPKDVKGTLRKLINYLGKFKFLMLVVFVLAISSTIFAIVGPKILGGATTELYKGLMNQISGSGDGVNFDAIWQIITTLIFLYFFSALLSYAQGFIMTNISMKITYKLRDDIAIKIHKLPFSYYDKTSTGDVLSRLTNDVDAISQSFNQSLTQIITSIAMLIGILVMMFSISWQMTLIALCILPISGLLLAFIMKKSQKHFTNQQGYIAIINGHVEEMYGNHIIVKAFGGEEESLIQFNDNNHKLYSAAWRANFMSGLMMPITTFIGNLGYVAICISGGYFASQGVINVGDIQAFIQYVRQFTQPIAQITQISNVIQQTLAASERVFEFLGEEEEVHESEHALTVNRDDSVPDTETNIHVKGNVSFEDISFGYDPEKIIINDFSANVTEGKKIAIVGPTGAGKTTIVNLLMRFYDVNSGAIKVDGHNIKDFKRDDLRGIFGMVLQDTWLFNGTIAENIRYGKLDATDEEVKDATKTAQAHHFITTLPDGYNMVLNEEASNVSQGQKQLITIARAILANPKVLILDEATSSVDTRTEILIQKAMDNLMHGRTSFIIAHRLSTIRNADLILVLDKGNVIEQGTHEDLLKAKGFYADLYNSQFAKSAPVEIA
jgi:ATP-binding cassette subfamily B protein